LAGQVCKTQVHTLATHSGFVAGQLPPHESGPRPQPLSMLPQSAAVGHVVTGTQFVTHWPVPSQASEPGQRPASGPHRTVLPHVSVTKPQIRAPQGSPDATQPPSLTGPMGASFAGGASGGPSPGR
jgi:hypothetical protein